MAAIKKNVDVPWDPEFAERCLPFEPVREAAHQLSGPAFPGHDDFNRLLALRAMPAINAAGRAVRFVAQTPNPRMFEEKYEPRIFLRGEIQVRPGNWHDVFNALAWLTFPRAKAALNEGHYHALERQRTRIGSNRTAAQDALTLLDESGVLVITAEPELGELLADHAWKELFWERRADVIRYMRFYIFGHGLGEKMLQPFVGATGRGLMCVMPENFIAMPLARQLAVLDTHVAGRIADTRCPLTARTLVPVPLLGIPGWCAENEDERYYDNTAYFRPRRVIGA